MGDDKLTQDLALCRAALRDAVGALKAVDAVAARQEQIIRELNARVVALQQELEQTKAGAAMVADMTME